MYQLKNITVEFEEKDGSIVKAVDNVSLDIKEGEIFGVIGYSGAGKSTLIRTINLLQRPSEGSVYINGTDMMALSDKDLRHARKKIGMIFQHFNLMESRTVVGNVAFPLRGSGLSKDEIHDRVMKLLDWVGLADKAQAYPSQLSGGQKQRVGIARALANEPDILLCDEATSALDPKTTKAVLDLLKDINRKTGITIILITHEMSVIKQVCDRVALMEDGRVVEVDSVFNIFSKPQNEITQAFINSASPLEKGIRNVLAQSELLKVQASDRIIRIHFRGEVASEPLLIELYKRFEVTASILFGNIEILQDTPYGTLLIALSGKPEKVQAAINLMQDKDLQPQEYYLEGGSDHEPVQ